MANRKTATKTNEVSDWYEQCIEWLVRQSGLEVKREPIINGQTPDLLVTQPNGTEIVIECLMRMKNPEHEEEFNEQNFHVCSIQHQNVYDRLVQKAIKYRKIANERSFIIALYDDECGPFVSKALDLTFSAHSRYISFDGRGNIVDSGWKDMWSTPEKPEGIFRLYPHVSGLLYSRWEREHYYLSNPWAKFSVPADLFPFACAPEAPLLDGQPVWEQRDRLVHDTYDLPPNTWWRQAERFTRAVRKVMEQKAIR